MRIGILSDTHDRWERTQEAVALLRGEGVEVLIHCGDLTEADMVYACENLPAYFVFGNNDVYNVAPIQDAIEEIQGVCLRWGGEVILANRRIAVTHGHDGKEIRRLLKGEPDYFLSGHTHVTLDHREGKTRMINPGALHRASFYSVGILDLAHDTLEFRTI